VSRRPATCQFAGPDGIDRQAGDESVARYDRVAVKKGTGAIRHAVLIALIATAAVACSATARAYRDDASLRFLTLGEPKEAVLATFGDRDRDAQNRSIRVAAMRMRAEQRTGAGDLLEVGEVPLIDRSTGRVTHYWVLFQNGRLAVWGRPEDWRLISRSYQIRFKPTPPGK